MDESGAIEDAQIFESFVSVSFFLLAFFFFFCLLNCYSFYNRDVWSFGVNCFEIFARSGPYPSMGGPAVAIGVMNKGLTPTLPESVPAPLAQIVRQCFAIEPTQRPTMESLYSQLTQLRI
jgi:serine/threonine protein kinase